MLNKAPINKETPLSTNNRICLLICLSFIYCLPNFIIAQTNNITYQESFEDFTNPDRGFYHPIDCHASNFTPLVLSDLQSRRTTEFTPFQGNYTVKTSLILRHYILDAFVQTDNLSSDFLSKVQADFDIAKQAGVRVIVRFSYTISPDNSCGSTACPPYGDVSKSRMLNHINQLTPIFQANEEAIALVQHGFIGIWGEQYYTDYFGDASTNGQGYLSNQNWEDRKEILTALLNAVPKSRMIQVRYPQAKQKFIHGISAPVTTEAMTQNQAFTQTAIARIGFHNDCFLASSDDFGTYWDYGFDANPNPSNQTTILKAYLSEDSKYVAVGGETCFDGFSPQNDCSGQAIEDMELLHFSFLNSDYNNDVVNDWETDGCLAEIKRRLGYRFVLKEGIYPTTALAGESLPITLEVENVGFAAPFNERSLTLILRNTNNNEVYRLPIVGTNTVTNFWLAGNTLVDGLVTLPNTIAAGNYEFLLHIAEGVDTQPSYCIRLANDDIWEATTGYNRLNHSITIQDILILKAKVLLEGAYQTNSEELSNQLQANNLIPNISPFTNAFPWQSPLVPNLNTIPNNAIDWLLIEILDNEYNAIKQTLAFLDKNGQLLDLTGNIGLSLGDIVANQPYYVILRHRNHLDIMSNEPLLFSEEQTHDFTTPENVRAGTEQLAHLGNEKYAMLAGDINGNGVITVDDLNIFTEQAGLLNNYLSGDCNLDGNITVSDFNLYKNNVSKIGVEQVRYFE